MGNLSDERTTINVKGMSVSSWERAKKAAGKQDESMGAWLTRAVEHLAYIGFPFACSPDPLTWRMAHGSFRR